MLRAHARLHRLASVAAAVSIAAGGAADTSDTPGPGDVRDRILRGDRPTPAAPPPSTATKMVAPGPGDIRHRILEDARGVRVDRVRLEPRRASDDSPVGLQRPSVGVLAPLSATVTGAHPSNRIPGQHVGVPGGTSLRAVGDSAAGVGIRATSSTTVAGADIIGRVSASGEGVVLTISSSRIRYSADDSYTVHAENGARIVLVDTEVNGLGQANRAATNGRVDMTRTWIRGMNEGPRLADGQQIVNSRIDQFFQGVNVSIPGRQPKNHVDGLQSTGAVGVRVLGNVIDANVTVGENAGYGGNAAGQFGEDFGRTDMEFAHNYVAGGQVALAANGSGTSGATVHVHHNTFKGDWEFGSRLKRDPAINRYWDTNTNVYAPGHAKAGQPVPAV